MRIDAAHKARLFRMSSQNVDDEPPAGSADLIVVQFNPSSLSYNAQNTLEKKSRDANAAQFVAQTTAKLEFDLVFDTTHDGSDVRRETDRIKRFLDTNPTGANPPPSQPAPPLVGFRWGSFKFKGFLESFRETLDFFSAEGVPLRSSVKVSLASLASSDAFLRQRFAAGDADAMSRNLTLAPVPERGTSSLAPAAGRAVAASNGFESMRHPGAAVAAVASAGVQLKAAAAFAVGAGAGASAGFGAAGGVGASVGVGAGVGLAAGAGLGASAGFGAGAGFGSSAGVGAGAGFGASAGFAGAATSRGVPAAHGAFAGLHAARPQPVARVDVRAVARPAVVASASAEFALGGRATGTASAGLKADVGADARIRFD